MGLNYSYTIENMKSMKSSSNSRLRDLGGNSVGDIGKSGSTILGDNRNDGPYIPVSELAWTTWGFLGIDLASFLEEIDNSPDCTFIDIEGSSNLGGLGASSEHPYDLVAISDG